MIGRHQVAQEISYASSARTKGGRAVIRVIENATGRLRLIRRADGYEREVEAGRNFWDVMVARYGLSLELSGGGLESIPRTGPVILVANHPYGILDGLMLGHILSRARGDFRILANRVFRKARDLDRVVLPISFDASREATTQNVETRKAARAYLAEGGSIGIFPGGTVSTALTPFGQPIDPGWRSFTARMIATSEAKVIPVFFEGANSRLFQIANHLHPTLRLALLINEFRARVDEPVRVVIGSAIPPGNLASQHGDPKAMMDFLRRETYALSPKPFKSLDYGFEFEERYRI